MTSLWLRSAGALLGYLLIVPMAYALVRTGSAARRAGAGALLCLSAASIPFWLPHDLVTLRFFCSLLSILFFIRLWEASRGPSASVAALLPPVHFALFLTSFADLQFSSNDEQRQRARHTGAMRLGRCALKALCLFALFSLLSFWPELAGDPIALVSWCLFAAYFSASAASDAMTGLLMLASGHQAAEVFRAPLVSRSLIEFWSQRWNLTFRNAAYRLIFVPAGGLKRPLVASALVFGFSAAVHEYLVVASLGYTRGHMAAFFVMHGLATHLYAWTRKRTPGRVPRPLGIALTWAWMLLTAPIFFAPILEIWPLDTLRLW